ncbi:PA14 domain-containing protein [Hymenobacter sp. B81]|uniref:PA14 domain-containing protein n=1 Tax=Hymenobacter sp. B81 TaxID=3344878 RepID=UPI0037DCBF87
MKPLLLSGLLALLPLLSRAQTSALPTGTGLQASYYNGTNFQRLVHRRIDPAIDFSWKKQPPVPGLGGEYFSVRWEGWILVPATAEYEFSTVMDDGLRVWLGGKQLINAWREQDHVPATVRIRLEAGRYYRLRVDYFQTILDSRALLRWRRADRAEDFVPVGQQALFAALPQSARPVTAAKPAPAPPPVAAAPKPAIKITPTPTAVVVGRRAVSAARPAVRPAAARSAATEQLPAQVTLGPAAAAPTDSLPDFSTLSKGTTVELRQLYFEQGKARMLPSSQPELNRLLRVLQTQPSLRLEIAGHTDNVGDAAKNLQLSQQRAALVRRYLVGRGIDSLRLLAQGYGGTRPVADNADPRQRPRNRRVEVIVR